MIIINIVIRANVSRGRAGRYKGQLGLLYVFRILGFVSRHSVSF